MAIVDMEYGREILAAGEPEANQEELRDMEMVLQNSSYGHQYAMIELQGTRCLLRQEEIHHKLEEFKEAYFRARGYLHQHYPHRLRQLEEDLAEQKLKIFSGYTA